MDRNLFRVSLAGLCNVSLSARRAWIEIDEAAAQGKEQQKVALRKESVDRNPGGLNAKGALTSVALRKESVDRNIPRGQLPTPEPPSLSARRAWIEIVEFRLFASSGVSLSARRAWIEILSAAPFPWATRSLSARRAWIEIARPRLLMPIDVSLSARRAWIEICGGAFARPLAAWSLSARRAWIEIKYVVKDSDFSGSRSPQGERG